MRQLLVFRSACLVFLVIADGLIAFKVWQHGPHGHEVYRFLLALFGLAIVLVSGLTNLVRTYHLKSKPELQLNASLLTAPFSQSLLALMLFLFAMELVM